MAKFKAIWGPYREEIQGRRIKWMFTCLLTNDDVRGYTLRFYYDSRKFSVKPHTAGNENKYAASMAEQGKLKLLPEANCGLIEGRTVTDILKSRLGDERIARATALAIQYGRT